MTHKLWSNNARGAIRYFYWTEFLSNVIGLASIVMGSLSLSMPNWIVISGAFFDQNGVRTDLLESYTNMGIRAWASASNVANTNFIYGNLSIAPFGNYGGITLITYACGITGMILLGFYFVTLSWTFTRSNQNGKEWFTKWEKIWLGAILPILVVGLNMPGWAYFIANAKSNLPQGTTFGPLTYGWCTWCFMAFAWVSVVVVAIMVWCLPDVRNRNAMKRVRNEQSNEHTLKDTETAASTASTTNTRTGTTYTVTETTETPATGYYTTETSY